MKASCTFKKLFQHFFFHFEACIFQNLLHLLLIILIEASMYAFIQYYSDHILPSILLKYFNNFINLNICNKVKYMRNQNISINA